MRVNFSIRYLSVDLNAFSPAISRRRFIRSSGVLASGMPALVAAADTLVQLPFENGERPLVKYPQKRPLIRLTARPPQLETPFAVFNEGITTPNDAFFVRYHLSGAPPSKELLAEDKFRLVIKGSVAKVQSLSLADLKNSFTPAEIVAVNQCSGNSRGFFQPRVPGGQLGNGAMGNAKWKGVRLKDVLDKAGLAASAKQVLLNGLDRPVLSSTPDFVKAIDIDLALEPDLLLAYEMNGEPLPWLNGYPLRLVVPGYFGTYWVKHLNEITVVDDTFKGFWMDPGYRIPDDACAAIEPGTKPKRTIPITRFNVRSFITSLAEGAPLRRNSTVTLRGIAFDGGYGIQEVGVSDDGGRTWRTAQLGPDLGKYSFREWTLPFTPDRAGRYALRVRATNRLGQSQPLDPLWNPAGYMRNVVETVNVTVS